MSATPAPPGSERRWRWSRAAAPYLLSLPAWAYLLLFFIIPLGAMLMLSAATGDPISGYTYTGHYVEFVRAIHRYHRQFIRSFEYGAVSTVITFAIAYPVSYWIAFHGGRHKASYLFLLLLPFFVTFVIRTLAWQFILSDQGIVLGTLKHWGLLPQSAHFLSTAPAVIGGLVYNRLPYYVMPLFVALEKVDRRLLRAAEDLYASPWSAFLHVVLPLSVPGIFAGFLLVFITNTGDYVNAEILGGPGTLMVGNIINNSFFVDQNYSMAAALSSLLLLSMLLVIALYARVFGTESIQDYAGS
ncbi:Polyamine ABC-type transport system, permease component potB [Thiomonas arsenitoxydans]|uniref:Polyamine ABC-type transport system, permease component potB n=1 Tax=Thiomonas arsenitoxydans (strain DSM 22701 / CIP 110005 / 3As) TaxID=426114 RepID=D6CQT7_THIA3|nr:ABC transporter permease [Thiomonas arsenitoxydans]CAZ86978.1 polyamine ABC-type transport system, permease component potB [Thiomonas arsenitoxydans]CQR27832.1 Polyamine ABC-type transport system, permease component potB [Thiomonas arsenitoxydans]CQR30135.1 Polyamine ABC-type transport system, permease component potB [Thiomonas arsenitoxydans]CQR32236.1 Polyamine ABC-type transport system, permease component potB [Thiomonas arsenitoxydans]CQR34257.1 Polyamine ABC-type transport system, perm